MQQMAVNWTVFGYCMAAALVFGILYAGLVRWVSRRGFEGQTAWSVVVGVAATLLAMIPVLGLNIVAIIFCFFAASGTPMIVEYLLRVQTEIQQDKKNAKELAKDLLNDTQTSDR